MDSNYKRSLPTSTMIAMVAGLAASQLAAGEPHRPAMRDDFLDMREHHPKRERSCPTPGDLKRKGGRR